MKRIYEWFLENVCGIWAPSTLAVIGHIGVLAERTYRATCRVMASDGITTEVVAKNVGLSLLIGIGVSLWLILEFADWLLSQIPNPDEIHGGYS